MIIGRTKEIEQLKQACLSDRSEFIAIYGRRRIGKTFLVNEFFIHIDFNIAGIYKGRAKEQLNNFTDALILNGYKPDEKIKNWLQAFFYLKRYLLTITSEEKKIIFIDEISWLDTKNSGFLKALENFWNGWACLRKDIVLIICGSATSWIINNCIHNKGGLYNRLTREIRLKEFTLSECLSFVIQNHLPFNKNKILEMYMIFGGIPYYWSLLNNQLSLEQNIDSLLFSNNSKLINEFYYLYNSVFDNADYYLSIIETLSTKKIGLTRKEIIYKSKMVNNGHVSKALEELELCGFIRSYNTEMNKNKIYQLIDFYTIFYYSFVKENKKVENYYSKILNKPIFNTWTGLAFERICLAHSTQIKKYLEINGISIDVYSFKCEKDVEKGLFGSQIDMIFKRNDRITNLFEVKYSNNAYEITKKDEESINHKKSDYQLITKTKNAITYILISPYGATNSIHNSCFDNILNLDCLFKE